VGAIKRCYQDDRQAVELSFSGQAGLVHPALGLIMWDILWLTLAFVVGVKIGRWFLIAQVKQLLAKIALDHNTTVDAMLTKATQLPQQTPTELQFRIEQVQNQYYAWGPKGFAAQHSDPHELIKLLALQYPNQTINLNSQELNLTGDKLTELLNKHDTN
jgi:uncharacterized protein YneF (UPF0154 family)